ARSLAMLMIRTYGQSGSVTGERNTITEARPSRRQTAHWRGIEALIKEVCLCRCFDVCVLRPSAFVSFKNVDGPGDTYIIVFLITADSFCVTRLSLRTNG